MRITMQNVTTRFGLAAATLAVVLAGSTGSRAAEPAAASAPAAPAVQAGTQAAPAAQPLRNLIVNGDFEDGIEVPSLWRSAYWGNGITLEPAGGAVPGNCLRIAGVTKGTDLRQSAIRLSTQHPYRLSARFRTQDHRQLGKDTCTVAVFNNGWTWDCRLYPPEGTHDWTTVAQEFTPAASAGDVYSVGVYADTTPGTVWVDDIRLEALTEAGWQAARNDNAALAATPTANAYLIQPRMNAIPANDGTVTLFLETRSLRWDSPAARRIRVRTDNGKAAQEKVLPYTQRVVTTDLGPQTPGTTLTLSVAAIDSQGNPLAESAAIRIAVIDPQRQIPANACLIDRRGRAIVNGKPFLPIGLYTGGQDLNDIKTMAAAGFNTVLAYGSLGTTAPEVIQRYDQIHALGMKVIVALNGVVDIPPESRPAVEAEIGAVKCGWLVNEVEALGVKGSTNVITEVVSTLKDHPALLAWYVADELPPVLEPALRAKRQLINTLDPFHPTYAVHCLVTNIPTLGGVADLIGVDPYPISTAKDRDMLMVVNYGLAAQRSGIPAWNVPQLFDWGAYIGTVYDGVKSDEEIARLYAEKQSRPPTEQEVRSMALEMAFYGTRGFIFYSFHDFKLNKVVAQNWERRWKEAQNVAALLNELAPFLLSDSDPVEPGITVEKGVVHARTFRDNAGRVRVLLTAIGPGEAAAIVDLGKEAKPLVSRYGKTTPLGVGTYRFVGTDIDSDVLAE
jgi:hypothetical protein